MYNVRRSTAHYIYNVRRSAAHTSGPEASSVHSDMAPSSKLERFSAEQNLECMIAAEE